MVDKHSPDILKRLASQAKSWQDVKIYKRSCCEDYLISMQGLSKLTPWKKKDNGMHPANKSKLERLHQKYPQTLSGSNLFWPACHLVHSNSWPINFFCLLINSHNLNNIGIHFPGILLASLNWLMLHKVCLRGKKDNDYIFVFYFNFITLLIYITVPSIGLSALFSTGVKFKTIYPVDLQKTAKLVY